MLGYVSLLYQDLIRQGPRAWGLDDEEANDPGGAGAAPPGGPPAQPPSGERRLPPVLPIVLYNGCPRWRAATEVADLIDLPPGRLARFEGKAETLSRQLTRRFGPLPEWVPTRLSGATIEQLDLWADRVLDAPTLEAVFGGH
jgi:hypothetical protein